MAATNDTIKICVHQLSGAMMELEVDPNFTVSRLKEHLSMASRVPAVAQQLIVDSTILQDDESLDNHCAPGDSILLVTMCVSWEGALSALDTLELWTAPWFTECERLKTSVEAFAKIAESDDWKFVGAMSTLCKHESSDIRVCATDAMATVAIQGNEVAIAKLFECLNDQHGLVRRVAATGLTPFVRDGDSHAIAALMEHQNDVDAGVRSLVQRALAHRECRAQLETDSSVEYE